MGQLGTDKNERRDGNDDRELDVYMVAPPLRWGAQVNGELQILVELGVNVPTSGFPGPNKPLAQLA